MGLIPFMGRMERCGMKKDLNVRIDVPDDFVNNPFKETDFITEFCNICQKYYPNYCPFVQLFKDDKMISGITRI